MAILRSEAAALATHVPDGRPADTQSPAAPGLGTLDPSLAWLGNNDTRLSELAQRMWRLQLEEQALKAELAAIEDARENDLQAAAGTLWDGSAGATRSKAGTPHSNSYAHTVHVASTSRALLNTDQGAEATRIEIQARLDSVRQTLRGTEEEYERAAAEVQARQDVIGFTPQPGTVDDDAVRPMTSPLPIPTSGTGIGRLADAHALRLQSFVTQGRLRNWQLAYAWPLGSRVPWAIGNEVRRDYVAATEQDRQDWPDTENARR
ncbi:MAG: hypothetical protein D8M59_00740 [Planctomycetes bacterium]|nr:hypothetical protein [Planctomycetota bacterium]NOG54751.1 hypothetical protein [Planctomycetota bacterium]